MTLPATSADAGATELQMPRTRRRARNRVTQSNFELYSWLFMRMSGILLVFLVLGHLLIMMVLGDGVQRINFAFVAGRWSSPFWQTWDLLQLWLAELHGINGLRTVINDYAEHTGTRFWLKMVLYASGLLILVLGTLVIFTFDPTIR